MERILIVSATEKSGVMLTRFLADCGVRCQTAIVPTGVEARRRNGVLHLVTMVPYQTLTHI